MNNHAIALDRQELSRAGTQAPRTVSALRITAVPASGSRSATVPGVLCLLVGLALALPAYGQMSVEEHASHHPGQADGAPPAAGASPAGEAGPAPAATATSTGGMGGGMGDMMKNMGKAPPKELYPTLMSLPVLTPEQRKEIQGQADERMGSAAALLSKGLDRLAEAAENDDYAAMQEATVKMREALAAFESGVAARRALAAGQPPRQVALQWFKSEMNLQPPQGVEARRALLGATLFHLFAMGLLIVFALAMFVLYFFKMRRAAALFGRLEASKGAPPPGAAPALAGAAPPAADATGTSI